jgi:hypothetical protein
MAGKINSRVGNQESHHRAFYSKFPPVGKERELLFELTVTCQIILSGMLLL